MRVVMWITVDHSACGIIQILLATCGRGIYSSENSHRRLCSNRGGQRFPEACALRHHPGGWPDPPRRPATPCWPVTQEVTVSGNIAKVETENATVSDVVTSRQIENLNLNGVNAFSLETLVPGAVEDNGNDTKQLGSAGTRPPFPLTATAWSTATWKSTAATTTTRDRAPTVGSPPRRSNPSRNFALAPPITARTLGSTPGPSSKSPPKAGQSHAPASEISGIRSHGL